MEVKDLPLTLLDVGEHEQRLTYDDEEQADLTASVRKFGILMPLIVRPIGERFLVVEGHRRRHAAREVGLPTVPAIIQAGNEAAARRTAFVTNFIRKDPTPVEMAIAIAKAVEEGLQTEEELAHALGRTVEWVKRQVAFLQWPEDVLAAIHRGKLSVAAASNLAQVDDDTYRSFLLDHATHNGATARTTAAWLQQYEASRPMQQAVTAEPVPAGERPAPQVPTAPCLCCGGVHRTDELSHVPLCAPCIVQVRQLGHRAPPPPTAPGAPAGR